jgi:hypothetical protein
MGYHVNVMRDEGIGKILLYMEGWYFLIDHGAMGRDEDSVQRMLGRFSQK